MKQFSYPIVLIGLIITSIILIILSISIGAVSYEIQDIISALLSPFGFYCDETIIAIVFDNRLPRTILAFIVGISLGVSGTILQGLFRNPITDPYSLGVSSGASLGSAISISFGLTGLYSLKAFAFIGALVASIFAWIVGSNGKRKTTITLLLAGSAIAAMFQALTSLLITLRSKNIEVIIFWIMGGLSGRNWSHVISSFPLIVISCILALSLSRSLDLLGIGEESAEALGVNIFRLRLLTIVSATLGTAASVSSTGAIGFIGLIAPHIARKFCGVQHNKLIPAAGLTGGIVLLFSDVIARRIISPAELPVGIITAIIGGPFFLYLLNKNASQGSKE